MWACYILNTLARLCRFVITMLCYGLLLRRIALFYSSLLGSLHHWSRGEHIFHTCFRAHLFYNPSSIFHLLVSPLRISLSNRIILKICCLSTVKIIWKCENEKFRIAIRFVFDTYFYSIHHVMYVRNEFLERGSEFPGLSGCVASSNINWRGL